METQARTPSPSQDPQSAYQALIAQEKMQPDAAQARVMEQLQALYEQLVGAKKKGFPFFGSLKKEEKAKSIYIWGNVGRGKSMLMELFFNAIPLARKRRVHFHAFMRYVHARMHQIRQHTSTHASGGDPLALLVQEIAKEVDLLCFDELQATDVADASLLFRLFEGLFNAGIVVVSTSNHPPASLYTGGVQRERFHKFIVLIEEKMEITALSSPKDYRKEQIKSLNRVYFTPLGRDADLFIEHTLAALAPECPAKKESLSVQGRMVPLTIYDNTIAVTTFAELCEQPLGPADYLAIAERVETLIVKNIPLLTPEKRNEAKRFVTLIDELYEHKITFICTAAAEPDTLYPAGDGSFEFQRTASRLHEMQSESYLQQ